MDPFIAINPDSEWEKKNRIDRIHAADELFDKLKCCSKVLPKIT
jgi:hypothetical protein